MSYKLPNHTQTPNKLFDVHMRDMDMAELKVTLAICRKTFGWHKEKDRISLTQLEIITGMSRTSVIKGIQDGIKRGTLERFACDDGFEYSLVVDAGTESEPVASTESEHTKESMLKKTTGGDIVDGILEYQKKQTPDFPEPYSDYLIPFCEKFPRQPTKSERSGWIKAASEWMEMGVKPEDIAPMFDYCKERGTVIKSPFSITYAFDAMGQQDNQEEITEWLGDPQL